VFTTPAESFEPTVMFFRLMSSSAMFQTMMNKILQDLINTRKITNFINDIIMKTEKKNTSGRYKKLDS